MLSLVFMGTAPFAAPCLEAVLNAGHRVLTIVTQPDRPAGRGRRMRVSPVKQAALEHNLGILQPDKASDPEFVARLRELAPQVIVVVAYGQILKQEVLDIPALGCVNVHGSLLPKYRGAAPIQRAILRGETETGVCTLYIDAGMDSGDVILSETEGILPDDTTATLGERLATKGAAILASTLSLIEAGTAPRHPQDPNEATLAPRMKREDGLLRWSESAAALHNRIRACNPVPGAWARRDGQQVKICRAEPTAFNSDAPPGTVVAVDDEGITIGAGKGALKLLQVQAASRGRQPAGVFARGYHVSPGEKWEDGVF